MDTSLISALASSCSIKERPVSISCAIASTTPTGFTCTAPDPVRSNSSLTFTILSVWCMPGVMLPNAMVPPEKARLPMDCVPVPSEISLPFPAISPAFARASALVPCRLNVVFCNARAPVNPDVTALFLKEKAWFPVSTSRMPEPAIWWLNNQSLVLLSCSVPATDNPAEPRFF
ncbi:hypothetical protein D3C73_1236460 [compost metagenome]